MSGYITPLPTIRESVCPMAPLRRRVFSHTVNKNDFNENVISLIINDDSCLSMTKVCDDTYTIQTYLNKEKFRTWLTEFNILEGLDLHLS